MSGNGDSYVPKEEQSDTGHRMVGPERGKLILLMTLASP